ncbi:MAG: DNA polymerase/3'-5' exonuclease PolX [Candidatus Berkelbacteria bacterium]
MTNKEIAHNLNQIASILEILDPEKNRFRILAYRKSAQVIENLAHELRNIYLEGGIKALNEIDGVGESIASAIEELLKTGKLEYLLELKKEVPVSEIEFLQIPGVGPKMAVKIARELKAKNISDLKKKIEAGKAKEVFQEKTAQNILRGIEILGKLSGKLLITEALPIAEEIVEAIKKFPETVQVDFVGSLRRMKETIGDIDIVATSKKPKMVIDQFVKLPFVDHVVTQGKTKSTIIHWQGVQVDLEIVPETEYGSLLQHFTGSKEHNVALRTYAQTQNKSVSEHGIKFRDKVHTFKTEKGVYEFLNMDFITPELREDRGEIEAALSHSLPKLVEQKDIKGDLHTHSTWSDGLMTIEEMVTQAEKMGYEYVAISDHTVGLGIANGLDEKALEERQKEIEKVQKNHKIKVLSAVEVNIKANGDLDIKNEMLEKMDLVIASIHTSFNQEKEIVTARMIKAIENPHVDIIGHPSGRIIGVREPCNLDWPQIFAKAAQTGTALEISSFPNRLDLADVLVQSACKMGVKFAINTDSHHTNHFSLMRYGVSVARRGWCEKSDIINTMSLVDLVKWTHDR